MAGNVTDAASQVGAAASNAFGAASGNESSSGQTRKTLYVGNLFFDVRGEDLEKKFSEAGNVVDAKIIQDQRGLSKGWGNIIITL